MQESPRIREHFPEEHNPESRPDPKASARTSGLRGGAVDSEYRRAVAPAAAVLAQFGVG